MQCSEYLNVILLAEKNLILVVFLCIILVNISIYFSDLKILGFTVQ